MQKKILLLSIFLGCITYISAQGVKIGENTNPADASAMLDVESISKGLLIPRMTSTNRDGISTPATGLMIYNTTDNTFQFYDGSAWVGLGEGATPTEEHNPPCGPQRQPQD